MDIEEIRADCSKACMKQMDICTIGDASYFTCRAEYTRCLIQCTAIAREEGPIENTVFTYCLDRPLDHTLSLCAERGMPVAPVESF
jgi:hypothetical protein